MRILFDSQNTLYKSPFGTLVPKELCMLRIFIPVSCQTREVCAVLRCDRTGEQLRVHLPFDGRMEDSYEHFCGEFSLPEPDLWFYHFEITTANEKFRLFRLGSHDTNMEAGDEWQLSVVSQTYEVPDWARGAVMYQIFPDRFARAGLCDAADKLRPFTVHEDLTDEPEWRPDGNGKILNNDFFGGNLRGIREKLPYLASLGVEILYLNPVFMAFSSHRYDTCDYSRIDPLLGTEEDFSDLCREAHARGMRLILDGVFSHTGSRSIYFDSARSDPDSPYRSWYRFTHWPDKYLCWWDFETLPCLDKDSEAYMDYLFENENSIVAKWLRLGADGFRLDVADELPDRFLSRLRRRMREVKPDSLLLGEVWEDASNKIAYDVRRRYFTDGELDGVMNYPWRTAVLRFCRGEDDGTELARALETLTENYPRPVLDCTMNLLSTHDVARALTALAAPFEGTRAQMAAHRLTDAQRQNGLTLLRLAAVLEFSLPGMPCIYYGDEAGMEGCKDPFNRGFYPWGREDAALRAFYGKLGVWRKGSPILRRGSLTVVQAGGGSITLRRTWQREATEITVDIPHRAWSIDGRKQEIV